MLTALYNNNVLYIDDLPSYQLKKLSDEKSLLCPDCFDNLVFKEYNERSNHFAHVKRDCTYPFREAESLEHESGKKALYDWLKAQFPSEDCHIEQHIKATNQRADTFVSSLQTAVEFQCSPIQDTTWQTRNNLYKVANVHDIWILGYSMHKPHSTHHRFIHKLNSLEQILFQTYGKIIYFDVLSKQFVFLQIEEQSKNQVVGVEYFFKPSEVFLKNGKIHSKYDYVMEMQKKRVAFVQQQQQQAKITDTYLKTLKEEASQAKEVLASKKQINYIKFLLHQEGKTIPYKLHGLKREEATVIIQKLIEKNQKIH